MMKSIKKMLLLACGWLALALGVIGIVLPVLPTAPFVLLAAACFLRSSTRLHAWLVEHPALGCHIEDYLAGRGLRRQAKVLALLTLWASVIVCTWVFIPLLAVDLLIFTVASGVSIYLLRLPTCTPQPSGNGAGNE